MTTDKPNFSLIINTTDRAKPLRTLLQALEQQSYPYFEVVVVVGPTRDNTLEILAEYAGRVRIVHCPKANLSQSRNIGLLAARGEIVAFIDDDAVPCYHWLAQLARLFANPNLDATGGVVYLVHPNAPIMQHRIGIISSLAEQVDVRSSWVEHVVPNGQGRQWVERMMGTNMAYRRSALLEIGGFDEFFEWLFDDSDIALRLANAGKLIHPVKQAVVYHIPASSRNRVAFSYAVRWWVQTKSVIYFSLKNGHLAGNTWREIWQRSINFTQKHWDWSEQMWLDGHLTFSQFWKMRLAELYSAFNGAWHGLVGKRTLLNSAQTSSALINNLPIEPFQNDQSVYQPAVDPINGQRSSITIPDLPLRLCLLSSAYPPEQFEGVGRHTHLMAQGLFACGHTVHVITRGEKNQVSFYDGAYVHRLAPALDHYDRYRLLPNLFYALNHSHAVYEKVKALMLNDGLQVVDSPLWQVDGLVTATSGLMPVVLRLQTASRQVATIQQNRDDDARLIGEVEQALVQRASHLVPNSQATVQAVQKVYHVQPLPDQYTIIPHGVIPVAAEAVRPFNLKHPPETLTVLYVGRLEKRKGILDLLQAIPLILKQVPQVEFVIAGHDNSQADGFKRQTGLDYAAYFAKRYRKLMPYIKFLGGVSEEKLQELYQTCDLFVAPSLYESFGLIYTEAMNYAKPVIGCQAGGIPEVVEHGVNGLLVEPEAHVALAEAIISLLKSPLKLYEMGLAGRQRLLSKFTYLQMAQNFEKVYRKVILC